MTEFRTSTADAVTKLPARDETAALAAAGGDSNLAGELVKSLVAGLPSELAGLQSRVTASDWPALADAAHRMRGATSYCGVPALDNRLQALERAAKAGDRERIAQEIAQVEHEVERLTRAVGTSP